MFNFFKKTLAPKELNIHDYPRGQYNAYWEIHEDEVPGGFRCEARINSYDGVKQHQVEVFISPTLEGANKLATDFIRDTMYKFKRA
jgi:hypothetical protein